jgi:integrase
VHIGQYPAWGIADAREKAKALRRGIDDGADVAMDKRRKKQEARSAWTVDDLARYYFELAADDLAPHTHGQRVSLYERFIKLRYGSVPVIDIKPADIGDCVRASADNGKTLPRNILILWTQLYHIAVGQGMVPGNPCRDLKAEAIVGKKTPAAKLRTALKEAELRPFLKALTGIPRPYELAIRLLLLTGVRVSQLSEAQAHEFDLANGIWGIPHERRKNRRHTQGPHDLPLPPEAIGWIKELLLMADRSGYLFPLEGRRHTQERLKFSKQKTFYFWLERMHQDHDEQWRRVTPHDLRATCKSLLSELRIDYEVRQRYLDHASDSAMDRVYDKSELLDQKADAARRLLAYLKRLETEEPGSKVVHIR